ncbi:hypothetical protein, partial [Methylocapsa sp. S129]|uniref:beta strand repeat-containing protein n=1 Tax=Methylocapsa sp. S129 TaxID=1641869 RepID=UPI001AEEC08C
GTQTIEATDAVGFTLLTSKAGDVDVTSDTASIAGGSVAAGNSASLTSATSNAGATVTATHGGVTLTAGSLAAPSASASTDWTNVNAGTSLAATSGGALTLTTTNSSGTQTIEGAGAVGFGSLTAKVRGDIFVTSDAGAIAGGSVAADGSAKLISATSNSGASVVATNGDADVEAGTLLSWSSVSAPKGNATVVAGTGDLTIESVTAGGAAHLEATAGNILPVDANATLISSSLTLTASENIGIAPVAPSTIATPFSFTLGAGGVLSGSAGGSAWLTSADAVNVTTFSVGNVLSLTAGGELRVETVLTPTIVDGAISSANGPVTLRAASFSMDSGAGVSAGGDILISATGDVTLGKVTSASADTTGNVIDIEAGAASLGAVVTAGKGSILGNGDAGAGIADANTGVWGLLNAGVAIGPLSVGLSNLNATADTGDLSLQQTAALHAATLSAVAGGVDVEGASALTLDSVTADTTFTAKSTASSVTIGSATSDGTETIEAYLGLGYTTLKT